MNEVTKKNGLKIAEKPLTCVFVFIYFLTKIFRFRRRSIFRTNRHYSYNFLNFN